MLDFEWQDLQQAGDWRRVLGAYRERQAALRTEQPDGDGWIPRVDAVEGVDADALPRIHGRLIAAGLLRYELADRADGMHYQLTPEGRRHLDLENHDLATSDLGGGME